MDHRGDEVLEMSSDPDDSDPDVVRREPAILRLTEPQRRYLERGLTQPGGKLPLFYPDGREVPPRTVQACVANGWAEPWIRNPVKPDWLVCRLTDKGRKALAHTEPPDASAGKTAFMPRGRGRKPKAP
jgi:hypothetical protein